MQQLMVIVLCLIGATGVLCRADEVRPLCWLSEEHGPAASSLRRALSVPGAKRPAQEMSSSDLSALYLDMDKSFGTRDEAAFRSKAYEVLDAAVSAERRLEEMWKIVDRTDNCYRAAYHFTKYRLRFAQALAKAEISRRMAETDATSYCTQAMESAIDCLKASAEARDEFEKLKKPQGYQKVVDPSAATIREFRESLLRIWHSSKTQGSLAPIRDINVGWTLNEAVERSVKDVKLRKEINGLFSWLGTSSAGNHPAATSVE